MMFRIYLTLAVCMCYIPTNSASLSCLSEDGNPVDWLISYKLPKLKDHGGLIEKGEAYTFFGPHDSSWKLSSKSIGDKTSFAGHTLKSIYSSRQNQNGFYILYNDEFPNGTVSFTRGHTKGVVAFDGKSGFWLIHSVPKFPPPANLSFSYPSNGQTFGQSFLCVSFSFSDANTIGDMLMYNDPYIYDFHLPDSVASQLPSVAAVVHDQRVSKKPWNITHTLSSLNQQPFLFFSKYKKFENDLYSAWVAPYLQVDLVTETWQNGAEKEKLPSFCSSDFTVENVKSLQFPMKNITFKSTHDHAKVAVSKDPAKPWICVGDINRQKHQEERGGGTACLKSASYWKLFHKLVSTIESCSSEERYQFVKNYWQRRKMSVSTAWDWNRN